MRLSELLGKRIEFHSISLASLANLSYAAERILRHWPSVVHKPQERDRDAVVAAILKRLQSNDWSGVTISDVTSAAVALFDSKRRSSESLAELRQFYCAEIKASTSRRTTFLSAMFAVYLESYVPEAPHTIALAHALNEVRDRIGGQWATFLSSFPACLDPMHGHVTLSERMTQMASPWDELRTLGLRSPHAPGLMDYVHLLFVERTAPTLAERPAIDRFLRWLQPDGQSPRASGAAESVSALLAPWANKVPSDDDKHYLVKTLTTMYGDPRVRGENAIWSDVPDSLRAIMERWLTGENIRFFLDVVSAVEKGHDQSHMWAPRKNFWLGLHNQKRIDAAWVAFSDDGVKYARTRSTGHDFLRFGRQVARGAREKTSLLILKIGNKIVVEGSHSYKVHVFRSDNTKAPSLYEEHYDCEAIRHLPGSWTVSHNGDWQGRVLEQI